MIEEKKQFETVQDSIVNASEVPDTMTEQAMSSETNPPIETAESDLDALGAEGTEMAEDSLEELEDSADVILEDADYQAAMDEMAQTVESLKQQLEERTNQYVRIVADFDNFRKRTQKEKEDLEQQIKCNTITELLPVVDNFERARSHIKPQTEAEMNIHKSYQGVYKQLVDCLKRVGVSPMRADGKEFDPMLHEAVMREHTDQYPEGTVIEELVRGYLLGERVLRHAMVKVAAAPDPVVTSEETDQEPEEG